MTSQPSAPAIAAAPPPASVIVASITAAPTTVAPAVAALFARPLAADQLPAFVARWTGTPNLDSPLELVGRGRTGAVAVELDDH